MYVLDGDVSLTVMIDGDIENTQTLDGEIGDLSVVKQYEFDTYDGEYEVIPSVNEQTLDTSNKFLFNDVTVKEIPFYETSNTYGTTVYIANSI